MYQTTVCIKGMHCRSCELLIEDELKELRGVDRVEVNHQKASAVMYHRQANLSDQAIKAAVKRAGYEVGIQPQKPWINRDLSSYIDIFHALTGVAGIYILVKFLGLQSLLAVTSSKPTSLLAVVLIGITAGLSTCMALVGGLVLGVSAKFAEERPGASRVEKFRPHLLFNLGRITSYTVLGGVIGILGSAFQLSSMGLGVLTILVAGVMLLLGLQLTNLFPRLDDFKLTLPASLTRLLGIDTKVNGGYSDKSALFMGATTFFLPCGFTQAMQLYAMSTGSFTAGAGIMGAFAIGTVPGLLSVGGLTSILTGNSAQKFFKFAGVVVVLLAIFNLRNGLNLTGFSPSLSFLSPPEVLGASTANVEMDNGKQIIRMTQSGSGYSPSTLTVVKGIPVKWIVTSTDPNTCAASLIASKAGVRANLQKGDNVFEFTPNDVGTIPFSCSMGMFRGIIKVVASTSENQPAAAAAAVTQTAAVQAPPAAPGCGSGGGGCGCGSGKKPVAADPAKAVAATSDGAVQVIKTTYTSANDIQPNQFTVTAGQPVRMEITAKDDGEGCMSSIMIPSYTSPQLLTAGQTITFNFTPKTTGDLQITCAMGVPRGVIKVN